MQPHGECEPPIGTLDITLDYVSVIVERWMVFPFLKVRSCTYIFLKSNLSGYWNLVAAL